MADVLDIRDQEIKALRKENELLNAFLFSSIYLDIVKELEKDLGMFAGTYMAKKKNIIYDSTDKELENMLYSNEKRYAEYRKRVLELWDDAKKCV